MGLRKIGRIAAGIVIVFTIMGLALYLARRPILSGVGALLTQDDPVLMSDAIAILSGDPSTRPGHAARLYSQGVAPRIALAAEELSPVAIAGLADSDTEITLELLQDSGVPVAAIDLISENSPVRSTRDEARALAEYVRTNGFRRVTVVTSPFHTARASYTLRHALDGYDAEYRMAAAPAWLYDVDRWWESEAGLSAYGMEILKWIYTLRVLE